MPEIKLAARTHKVGVGFRYVEADCYQRLRALDSLPDGHPLTVTVSWEEPRREVRVGDYVRHRYTGAQFYVDVIVGNSWVGHRFSSDGDEIMAHGAHLWSPLWIVVDPPEDAK